jgi:hypothetical protein
MNNLPPTTEAMITGSAYAGVGLVGAGPEPGDQIVINISGGPLSQVQQISATAAEGDTNTSLAIKLGVLGAQNPALQAAGIQVLAPYGINDFVNGAAVSQPLAEITVTCPQNTFNLSVQSFGSTGAVITSSPSMPSPQGTVGSSAGQPIILYGYIPILNYLEGAWMGTTQNLDTRQADVWKANPAELKQRKLLYEDWKWQLADRLMVPVNPNSVRRMGGGGSRAVL